MWLTRKRKTEARRLLAELLDRMKLRIDQSEESCYAGLSPAEISMDSGWTNEYLELSKEFDGLIEAVK